MIDPNAQYATANSYQTQQQSATGRQFLANLGKYGQAGIDSWNANPQSFSVNDFNRIAATNPTMATQMEAAGGQNYRNAIMQNNGWSNTQNNEFINGYGSGALPGFKGYTGAGQGIGPGAGVMGQLQPHNQANLYGQGYTGFGGTDLSATGNPVYGAGNGGGNSGPAGSASNPYGYGAGFGHLSTILGVNGAGYKPPVAPTNPNPTTARRDGTAAAAPLLPTGVMPNLNTTTDGRRTTQPVVAPPNPTGGGSVYSPHTPTTYTRR